LILSKLYIALRLKYLWSFVKVLFDLFRFVFFVRIERNPVHISIQKLYHFGNLKFNDVYVYKYE